MLACDATGGGAQEPEQIEKFVSSGIVEPLDHRIGFLQRGRWNPAGLAQLLCPLRRHFVRVSIGENLARDKHRWLLAINPNRGAGVEQTGMATK